MDFGLNETRLYEAWYFVEGAECMSIQKSETGKRDIKKARGDAGKCLFVNQVNRTTSRN